MHTFRVSLPECGGANEIASFFIASRGRATETYVRRHGETEILSAVESAAKQLGYTLRDKQRDVVVGFIRGQDTFVSLPTGSGKSLCYSVLPWTYDKLKKNRRPLSQSVVIVVSPLIALMKDKVSSLQLYRRGTW